MFTKTSEAFIAAVRRFVARRGLPTQINCDNGRNFVGANNALKELYDILDSDYTKIANVLCDSRIVFRFIPLTRLTWEACGRLGLNL